MNQWQDRLGSVPSTRPLGFCGSDSGVLVVMDADVLRRIMGDGAFEAFAAEWRAAFDGGMGVCDFRIYGVDCLAMACPQGFGRHVMVRERAEIIELDANVPRDVR